MASHVDPERPGVSRAWGLGGCGRRRSIRRCGAYLVNMGSLAMAIVRTSACSLSLSGVNAPAWANSTAIFNSCQWPVGTMACTGKCRVNRNPSDILSMSSNGWYHALSHRCWPCGTGATSGGRSP